VVKAVLDFAAAKTRGRSLTEVELDATAEIFEGDDSGVDPRVG
jgi:hypothetical protein